MLDESRGSRTLTPAERDFAMAEALRAWDDAEKEWRDRSARAIAHQAEREAARIAAGLPPKCEAELEHEAQLEREWAEMKRHRA